jgi:hypothetical protein
LQHIELLQQGFETLAVLGNVNRVDTGAKDRHAGLLQGVREFEGGLSAKLYDHAQKLSILAFSRDDFQHIFASQWLKIQPV